MEDSYVLVSDVELGEPIEMPVESDGSVLLSSIQSQFPSAIGLKFRNPATKAFRAIRLVEGRLLPPNSDSGWDPETIYLINSNGESEWPFSCSIFFN